MKNYIATIIVLERFGKTFGVFEHSVVVKANSEEIATNKIKNFLEETNRFEGFFILDCDEIPIYEFPLWLLNVPSIRLESK
jgi:hypothetical protein